MPLPPDSGPVLPWSLHDRKHEPHPLTGKQLYVLDYVSDDPRDADLRYCRFCGRYVEAHPKTRRD